MTMWKAPITLALFGVFVVLSLLFTSCGNELFAKLPPQAYHPNDRQYAVMEVKAVLEPVALAHWAPALSGDQPPFHNIAFGSPKTPPEALWLTPDLSLTVASGACGVGSISLCAVIVGINDPGIRIWATEICGLPIFWDLMPEAETSNWNNGRILDLETLQDHSLNVSVMSGWLVLRISDQAPIQWQQTTVSPVGCGS